MSTELSAPPRIEADPIGTALVKAGITSAAIEDLAKQYGELAKLPEVTTEEEYEQVHRAQLAHRDIRVAVVAALKEEREEAVRFQKLVVSEERRIVGLIEQTETPLKKLKDDWNHKAELKVQEEARQWAERMNLRKQAAFDIGYYFNGLHYLLDRENGEAPWVLREDQLCGMAMSDEALYALLDVQAAELKVTREIQAEAEARAEEERLAKEAAAKAEADRIAAAQAEIERKEREMAEKERRMNERINVVRKAELIAMGMVVNADDNRTYPNELVIGDMVRDVDTLYQESDEDWANTVMEAKDQKQQFDAYIEEQGRIAQAKWEQQEQERIARDEQLKAEAAQRAVAEERERVEREREAKEKEAAILAQQEADRIASMGDKELVEQLSVYLSAAPLPELHTAIGRHGMERVRKHIDELIRMVNAIAKDLEP